MVQVVEDFTLNLIPGLLSEHVKISNQNNLLKKLSAFRRGGKDFVQIITDFDQTISKQHVNGERQPSSFGILALCETVPKDFLTKNRALAEKYYPIEMDPHLSREEKLPHIVEWYALSQEMFDGLVFDHNELKQAAKISHLRERTSELFMFAASMNIPTLVLSAGLGDVIRAVLANYSILESDRLHIISNFFKMQGDCIRGFGCQETGEFIHPFNKNGLGCNEYFRKIDGNRRNVIILGDTVGDSNMAEGVPQLENVLKIGFLFGTPNHITSALPQYLEVFDIVLVDDQTMNIPCAILEMICR